MELARNLEFLTVNLAQRRSMADYRKLLHMLSGRRVVPTVWTIQAAVTAGDRETQLQFQSDLGEFHCHQILTPQILHDNPEVDNDHRHRPMSAYDLQDFNATDPTTQAFMEEATIEWTAPSAGEQVIRPNFGVPMSVLQRDGYFARPLQEPFIIEKSVGGWDFTVRWLLPTGAIHAGTLKIPLMGYWLLTSSNPELRSEWNEVNFLSWIGTGIADAMKAFRGALLGE